MPSWDAQAVLWLNSLVGNSPLFDSFIRLIVNDYFVPTSLSLILLGLWVGFRGPLQRERNQRTVLSAAGAVGIACIIILLSNHLIEFQQRPFAEYAVAEQTRASFFEYRATDSSFPSEPTAFAFALATAVWLGHRRWGGFIFGLSLLFGFARVYAGVHYPSDIAAGALIGLFSGFLTTKVLMRITEPLPTLILRVARRLYLG